MLNFVNFKVFCLLSKRLPHDLWDAYDLFYYANTELWGPYTDFYEGAEYVLEALEGMQAGLYGAFSYS